jgi:hypothetical protein
MIFVTIGVITCNREKTMNRFLDSLFKYNKDIDFELKILDNSNAYGNDYTYHHEEDIDEHIKIDKPIGLTESSNILMDKCNTKYFFLFHDDMYFNKKNVIANTIKECEYYDYDILSVILKDNKQFRVAGKTWIYGIDKNNDIKITRIPLQISDVKKLGYNVITVDEGTPCILMNMHEINDLRWDEYYKWKGDQQAFYFRAYQKGLKVGVSIDNYIAHERVTYKDDETVSLEEGNYGEWDREYFKKEYGVVMT